MLPKFFFRVYEEIFNLLGRVLKPDSKAFFFLEILKTERRFSKNIWSHGWTS